MSCSYTTPGRLRTTMTRRTPGASMEGETPEQTAARRAQRAAELLAEHMRKAAESGQIARLDRIAAKGKTNAR